MSAALKEGRAVRGFDPEAEQDVDLGRYLRLLGAFWWVVAAGFVVGAVVGVAVVAGQGQTYQATATLYLGLPYGAGDVALQSAETNPSTLDQIVHSFAVDEGVAQACKAPVASFVNGISTQQVAGTLLRNRQNAYVTLSVLARKPKLDRCAANGLARAAVAILAPYSNGKVAAYRAEISSDDRGIAQARERLTGHLSTSIGRLAAVVQRLSLEADRARARQLLLQVAHLEEPRLIGQARAARVTARGTRSSAFVAGMIGMLLGVVLVCIWGVRGGRRNRPPVHV
jgi:hypothetical protein